jgi:hypothetical protein
MTDAPDICQTCRREIEALHQFFEDWLRGECPNTDAAFERLRCALASDFRLIHPSGRWTTREDILTGLCDGHGRQPSLTIDIRDVRLRQATDELAVATYEEWQETGASTDGRLSTVAFRREVDAPNGLRWLHVHETWLEASEGE